MPIFQKSVVQDYVEKLDQGKVEKAYQTFRTNYNSAKIEQIKTLKEEEYQDGFLRDIFVDVFGYTLRPEENYNLQREFKNQTDGKKADGAILKDDNAIAVIELKSTSTKDLTKVTQQAFNYKNNQPECKYVITSNFQKLRFYIAYSNEFEEFDLFFLDRERFEVLYLILQKDNIFANLPTELKTQTLFHEKKVSEDLYSDYSHFKEKLFLNLLKNHPEDDKLLLFKKSQKLLDRFLFILFAEDSKLLPTNSISRVIDTFEKLIELDAYKPLYEIFKQYFGYMNIGRPGKTPSDEIPAYNGGLFYEDLLLNSLTIDDDVLIDDLQKLSKFDFNTEVDVNILGHIFEHSLNEIENVTAEIEGTVTDQKRTKRKKDGVFYTPKYITTYIVANTIGTLCIEKRKELDIEEIEFDASIQNKDGKLSKKGQKLFKKLELYKKWLIGLKIIDPACGSGAFLNQALIFLIEEHEKIDDIIAELTNSPLRLFDTDKNILENNLFGVDINEESVEIAQLSLWLRTARKGRKLSKLNNNIKCGNSLRTDEFDWSKEFPDIMKNGGFDVVIGNPPYIKEYTNKQAFNGLHEHYCYQGKMDLWYFFGALALAIVKKDSGLIGYIAPNNWITNSGASKFRNIILNDGKITEFVDFGDFKVFDSAGIQTMIYVMKRSDNNTNYTFDYSKVQDKRIKHEGAQLFLEHLKDEKFEYFTASIDKKESLDNPINFVNAKLTLIVDKIREYQNFEFDKKEIAQGIVPNPDVVNSRNISKFSKAEIEENNIEVGEGVFVIDKNQLKNSRFLKPLYEPENFDRFYHNKNNSKSLIYIPKKEEPEPHILEHLEKYRPIMEERRENKSGSIEYFNLHWPRDEEFFSEGPKVLSLRKCPNRPVFSYTEDDCYVMLSFNVIKTERLNSKYLTALLNSNLIAFWLKYQGKMQGDLYQVDKGPLMNIPVFEPNKEIQYKVAELVSDIIANRQKQADYSGLLERAKTDNDFDREIQLTKQLEQIETDLRKAESNINTIVYGLYEIDPTEIATIEKNINL